MAERPLRLKWADSTGISMQRSAFIPALRRPLPRSFRYLRAAQFWVLALVAAAVLLVLALQWRATAQAEIQAQISTEKPVAARPPQPEHVSGASARPGRSPEIIGPARAAGAVDGCHRRRRRTRVAEAPICATRHHAHGRSAYGAPSRNRERRVARRRRGRPSRRHDGRRRPGRSRLAAFRRIHRGIAASNGQRCASAASRTCADIDV